MILGLSSFVSGLYSTAEGRGHGIAEVVDGAISLVDLEEKTKKGYEELLKSFEEMSNKGLQLAEDVKDLKAKAKEAKEARDKAIEDRDATDEALTEFCAARDALKEAGADVADFASLGKIIANAKELNFNPKKMVDQIAVVESLGARRSKLEKTIATLEDEKGDKERVLVQIVNQLEAKRILLEKVQDVEELGLSVEDLETLRRTIAKVGARHGLGPADSLKLIKDIRDQYDDELGFENQLETIRAQVEATELKSETWSAKLEKMVSSYRAEKSVVDAMRGLLEKGVDGQMILDWNAFLEKLGTDIEHFGKDLEAYPRVKELIEAKEEEAGRLEKKVEGLNAQVKELEGKRSELVSSIRAVSTSGIEEVRRAGLGIVADVKAAGDRMKEEASKQLEGAKMVVDETKVGIDGLYEEALRTGRMLGDLKYMEPIHKLVSSCEGDPPVVYSTLKQLFFVLEKWLEKNPPKNRSLLSNIKNVSNSLNEEMSPGQTK